MEVRHATNLCVTGYMSTLNNNMERLKLPDRLIYSVNRGISNVDFLASSDNAS